MLPRAIASYEGHGTGERSCPFWWSCAISAIVEIYFRSSELPSRGEAEALGRVARDYLQMPAKVRLPPELIVEGSVNRESGLRRE